MVDYLPTYLALLERGITLFDTLAKVYEPDSTYDWASRTLMQIGNTRMGLAGRMSISKLTDTPTTLVTGLISRYMDSHWADYLELPKPDPAKRARVLELHEDLTAVMNEMGAITNALYDERMASSKS